MKTLKNNIFMLKCVAKYTPAFFFWTVIEGLVWGCIHSFTSVLFVKALFDRIENSVPFPEILSLVGLMAVFFIITYIFHEWYWHLIEPKARQTLHQRMQSDLFNKAKELDLACYDNPSFYTDFVWAISEADSRSIQIVEDLGKIINRVLSTSVIISVLLTVDVWIVLAICGSVGITVGLKIWKAKLQFKRDLEIKPIQRKADYIGRVFYLADYAKEIRSSQAKNILHREFDSSVTEKISLIRKYSSKLFAIGTAQSISTSMLFDVGIILLLVYKIMVQQSITLGDFAASVSAIWKLFWQIGNLMEYISKFKEHSLYAEKFKMFLNYCPTVCDKEKSKTFTENFNGFELRNVSFTYPDTDNPILKDISLTIKPGEKIAFVGYNGAGKSTLVKLIMRLYDPTSGEIRANDESIKNYAVNSYRNKFGTVFQDFQIFASSIAENVLANEYTEEKQEVVLEALRQSGFEDKLNSLPNSIQTQLTREFDKDGINLSGGEAQKIAIARIFAKPCDIVILDEPSSALDPMSEYELNQTMMSAAYDKTVIFISHRLSTTKMADRIYMLENGEIIENGSHNELMRKNGKYAEMFNMQAEKYNIREEVTA